MTVSYSTPVIQVHGVDANRGATSETQMANWHLEERMRSVGELRLPHFLLVGDNGVEVRLDFSMGWFAEYRSTDLQVRFSVYRDPPSGGGFERHPARRHVDMVLGPHCLAKIDFSRLSRPLEQKDCEPLAVNFKEVLRAHLRFPGAVPPKIERVRFLDPQLQPFDD
jgi:hypothetical protein